MKREITYFQSTKDDNTEETFELVKDRIQESGTKKIILASTTGRTALKAMEFFNGMDLQLIIVPHQFGFSCEDNHFPKETVVKLNNAGHQVYFGTMLFHTDKLFGNKTPTVVANFLRCFSEGVKVCYEITLMAADGGHVESGESVIAIAGTARGADTAMLMQGASTRNLEKLRVNELICKPYNAI